MAKGLRIPKLDLVTVLEQQNPQIDLRLESYEVSTQNFLRAVSSYTQRAITEITNRKNVHLADRKKYSERIQQIETETNHCKVKEIELIKVLDREQEEKKELETSVAAFKRQLASFREKCSSVEAEIEQHRAIAANLQRERSREENLLNSHAARMAPELSESEAKLQCVVEGIEKDKLLVRFLDLDPGNREKECNLVIDVSSRSYKVPTTTPYLPTLPILLDELNETRDVYTFIKNARSAFKKGIEH
ncbi:chromosome segregation protein Spc25-domain-containing protein [Fomitopsis betulina]|nr:chromosome segregation protein Spc25-domain-containing protein [Fomitopsis betulina]